MAADPRLLTRCSWCERVRLDEVWIEMSPETATPQAPFTHGICHECMARALREFGVAPGRRSG